MLRSYLIATLLAAGSAVAQLSTDISFTPGGATLTFEQQQNAPNYAFTGAPYSATQTTSRTQSLANGSRTSQKSTLVSIWQDSFGRKRTDQQYATPSGSSIVVTQIVDPVAGAIYVLDPAQNVAHRVKITATVNQVQTTATPMPDGSPSSITNADGSTFATEILGSRIIGGLNAFGSRITTHYPAGSPLGNDKPMDTVTESWNAPQIGAQILFKIQDPRFGDSTVELENVVAGEPDPSMLKPPADYVVADETGPFQVRLTQLP